MQNFIVLGYIPGTQIQITFGSWLCIVALFAAFYVRSHKMQLMVSANNIATSFSHLSGRWKQWLAEPVILQ